MVKSNLKHFIIYVIVLLSYCIFELFCSSDLFFFFFLCSVAANFVMVVVCGDCVSGGSDLW